MAKTETPGDKRKPPRMSDGQIVASRANLYSLMEDEKLLFDNELSLPTVAARLGLSIHDTSFLINKATNYNF